MECDEDVSQNVSVKINLDPHVLQLKLDTPEEDARKKAEKMKKLEAKGIPISKIRAMVYPMYTQ